MADVAKLSYDPARQYQGLVKLQGRVALEADDNEQRLIDHEERRKELIDIIGPAGTPDNGYALTASGTDITVGIGTMYVGGLRVELDQPITLAHQPDWLDQPPLAAPVPGHAVLMLEETDVSAVEDPALAEVALGGPDSAARTRLLQRITVLPTQSSDCGQALIDDESGWKEAGLVFDKDTMALKSVSRIAVAWDAPTEKANPCEPTSTGGYLGADNQLIRVQITHVAQDGTFDLVWGYDNASMLYRITADASATPVLTLQRSPVDDYHRPRTNQAVQVLRSTATLASTDGAIEGYVAAHNGVIGVLGSQYDPDTKTMQFPTALPAEYTDPKQTPQLYLRVWEELLTGRQLGQTITLTGTGLSVTLSSAVAGSPLHIGDFWSIAVRPDTPTVVYPERYLRGKEAQPPDGPRLWVCPLYVLGVSDNTWVIDEDCRHHFPHLVDVNGGGGGGGCCTVEVTPADAHGNHLQTLIDAAAEARPDTTRTNRITVCFQRGAYELETPILLDHRHSNMELRGCSESVVLAPLQDFENNFPDGVIVLKRADNVTITGFEIRMPQVATPLQQQRPTVKNRAIIQAMNVIMRDRYISIGIRPVHCAVLEVSRCLFRFSVGERDTTPEAEKTMPRSVFGVGVFGASQCHGLRLEANRFLHEPALDFHSDLEPQHVLVGYLLLPTIHGEAINRVAAKAFGGDAVLPTLLYDGLIRDNIFDGITVAVMVSADLGILDIHNNIVRRCYGGVWLLDPSALPYIDLTGEYQVQSTVNDVRPMLSAMMLDGYLALIRVLGSTYPLPPTMTLESEVRRVTEKSSAASQKRLTQTMTRFLRDVAGGQPADKDAPTVNFNAAAESPDTEIDATPCAFQPAHRVNQQLMSIERDMAVPTQDQHAQLHLCDNDIECGSGTGSRLRTPPTAAAAVLAFFIGSNPTSLILGNNRLATNAPLTRGGPGTWSTVVIMELTATTVTGNIIRNNAAGAASLVMVEPGGGPSAITGNVLAGPSHLPQRSNQPAGLDTWDPFNTETT
ncbi:DUF6519 domain-containing protein [Mycobacterium sp.]|uniref:DUF6519 domain-containing protein n=1 Tax=Mycobacterium sp. TaxID=1785 RepID=UPI003D1380E9